MKKKDTRPLPFASADESASTIKKREKKKNKKKEHTRPLPFATADESANARKCIWACHVYREGGRGRWGERGTERV